MIKREAIVCQVRAIADYIASGDYTAADLREISVEMTDTRALVEQKIKQADAQEERGNRALRQLLTGQPEGGAA